jgi:hypothetical protein
LVGHEEVIVTLTSDALVAAEAGTVAGRSEQTTETNRAVRSALFITHLIVGGVGTIWSAEPPTIGRTA